jgi:ATP-dependent Lhr-like helicase
MLEILYSKSDFEELDQPALDEINQMRKDFSIFNFQNLQVERPLLMLENHLQLFTFTGTRINRTIHFLLNLLGIKNALNERESRCEFHIESTKKEIIEKWNLLTQPIPDIDTHISSLLQTNPVLLNFSKWGLYLPTKFKIALLKEEYFDFNNIEQIALFKLIENKETS